MLPLSRSIASFLLAVSLLVAEALGNTFLVDGYAVRVWQTQDGLPQNHVTSAAQTRDGYLWFGTNSGLARFDGERFQVFHSANTSGLRDGRITRLFEDAGGTLWIGHEAGTITRYQQGRFEEFAQPSGIENEKIIGLGSDEQGRLWAMRENGAVDSLSDSRRLPSLIAPHLPGIMDWTRNSHGNIWLAENGQAARLTNGELTPIAFGPSRYNGSVTSLAAADDGSVWVLYDGRIRKWKNGHWTEDRGEFPWPAGSLSSCLELRDGTLAIGTIYSGLYLVFGDGRQAVRFHGANGLPQNWVRFLYEDREGNLWAGTGSAGLVSIHATAFSVLNSPDQWRGCTVLSIAPGRDQSLWIGTDGAGLYNYSAGKWTHYGEPAGLGNLYVHAVTETQQGQVWAGNFWWGGPYRLEDGRFVRPAQVDTTSSPVLALVSVPGTSELLVGNRDGLLQLGAERSRWLIKSPEGSSGDVSALILDRQGVIWCGFAHGGLARLSDGKLTHFRRKDGLASDAIQCLYSDDDSTLWIGTADNGLIRLKDGRFANMSVAQGLADHVICHILDDGLGYLWLSTHHGLQRVAKTELNRCVDRSIPTITSRIYDRSDGLPVIEFVGGRQAAGCRTVDGRLWFASSKGVISVDPSRIQSNNMPPPVVLGSLVVDGKNVPVANAAVSGLLSPDHQRLEFHFSGLSFTAPNKVLFKYRLEGIDEDWIESGPKRSASYSRLHAGTYRFRVIACNNDGVWNTEGASLTFGVAPFIWETWWFIGACLLLAAIGVASLARFFTRRRMQRKFELMKRQHELEHERARIAQDIHDDVGASLSRIAMLSQPARADLAEPERMATMLSRIYSTAREVTRSLDEIVWAVDPRHDTLDSLVDYMGKFAQNYLAPADLRCRLDLPVEVPPWPLTAEVRHNLFLAFKEALNNAVKHANATEVRIAFRLRPNSFVLELKDNGRGFSAMPGSTPPQAATLSQDRIASGHGLQNMQARLARIGGQCEISSEPEGGTNVLFVIDVSRPHDPNSV